MMKNNNNNVEIEILSTKHGPDRPRVFFSGGGGDKTKTRLEEKLYKLEKEKKKTEKWMKIKWFYYLNKKNMMQTKNEMI